MSSAKGSTKGAEKRRTVTIDITEWYDSIAKKAKDEVRTVEEQCRFFIKKGVDEWRDFAKLTYVSYNNQPSQHNQTLPESPYKWATAEPYCINPCTATNNVMLCADGDTAGGAASASDC